jgi:hypothetical protein
MRPQSKEYPVKRFIPISRSDRVVQLYWYTPLPQDFGRATRTHPGGINAPSLMRGLTLDQFLTMRYNTGLTAAPASPLYGSPVFKRSPIQVLTTQLACDEQAICCLTSVIEGTGAFNIAYGRWHAPTVYSFRSVTFELETNFENSILLKMIKISELI